MTQILCEVIRDLLPSYVDGLTSEVTDKMIREHLEECEECRKIMESMREGETEMQENLRQIDFLKKANTKMRTTVIRAILGVLAAIVLIGAIRLFAIGDIAHPDSLGTSVKAEGNTYTIEGDIMDSIHVVSGVKTRRQDDTLYVTVRYAPVLFGGSSRFHEVYESSEPLNKICVNDRVVWQEGVAIYPDTARVLETAHPYVGDITANLKTAEAAGCYEHFGPFVNELQTEKEPYGWTIILKEPLSDQTYQETRMEKDACILIAMTENLSKVTFRYRANGKEYEKTITEADADAIAWFHVKDAYNDYVLTQRLLK